MASDSATLELSTEGFVRAGLSAVPVRSVPGARLEVEARALDLIILDLTVFGPSGLGFLRWLRGRPDKAGIPILVLTGRDRPDQISAGLRAGANAYTTKPIDWPVLEACAEALLRQGAMLRAARREGEILAELAEVEAQLARTVARQEALARGTSPAGEGDGGPPVTGEPLRQSGGHEAAPARTSDWRSAQPRDTAELASVDWVLFKAVEGTLSRCMETGQSLSVLMIEAQALDALGPGEGAAFLDAFSQRVNTVLGEDEELKPIAGRTFCVVLPDVDGAAVHGVAERIVSGVERDPLPVAEVPRRASACIGAASLRPELTGSPFHVVDRAHAALERAKQTAPTGYCVYEDALHD